MKTITVHRLIEAYAQANNLGWKTFYTKTWRQFKKSNRRFCNFLEDFIQDQESELCLAEYETDYLKEAAALILLCRDLSPIISSSTLSAIEHEIHFTAKEEDRLEEIGEESQAESSDGEEDTVRNLLGDYAEDEIFRQRDLRRQKIYQEGRHYLISKHLDFFREFKKFIADVSCGEETLIKVLYRLTDLMFAVYSRQEDNIFIDSQFNKILKIESGQ